jgi:hypothetical protein
MRLIDHFHPNYSIRKVSAAKQPAVVAQAGQARDSTIRSTSATMHWCGSTLRVIFAALEKRKESADAS